MVLVLSSSSLEIVFSVTVVSLFILLANTTAYAQTIPTTVSPSNSYPPIVPSSVSPSQNRHQEQIVQEARLAPIINNTVHHAITPAHSSQQQELMVSINAEKNPVSKGKDQIFNIAVLDLNSNSHIQNAKIIGLVFDPSKNSIQNQFSGISNSNGTYSYTWTVPKTIKSQTYEVRVNASAPIGYTQKSAVTTFDVKGSSSTSSSSSDSHDHDNDKSNSNSNSDDHHRSHDSGDRNHSGDSLANRIIRQVHNEAGIE
jgi:hypothetical protein